MIQAIIDITLELAPWLLLGVAIAGILHIALPAGLIHRQLRGRWGVFKAVLLGVPLPLCSCGVIPAGLGLRKDGASQGATVGFLISTPQTGVDSILVSASFLGWPFAIFKLLAAAVTGLIGGWLADATTPEESPSRSTPTDSLDVRRPGGLREMLEYSAEILRSIWRWLVFGILVSAAITTLVPDQFFTGLSELGVLVPLLASLAVSLPLYVCATASVPIAAALVASGMPGGAALVFLMAGPATNVATLGAVYRALGGRTLAVYLSTLIGGSLAAGLFFDSVLSAAPTDALHHHGEGSWWQALSAVALALMLLWFAFEDLRSLVQHRRASAAARHQDESPIEVEVAGMTCGGCSSRLERALNATAGVRVARVDLEAERATVSGTISAADILMVIQKEGFRGTLAGSPAS